MSVNILFGECCCFPSTEEWFFRVKYRFPQGAGSSTVEILETINCEPKPLTVNPGPTVYPKYWPSSGIETTRGVAPPFYLARFTAERQPPPDQPYVPGGSVSPNCVSFVDAISEDMDAGNFIDNMPFPAQAFNPDFGFGDANPIDITTIPNFNPDLTSINTNFRNSGRIKGGLVSSVADDASIGIDLTDPFHPKPSFTGVSFRDFWYPPGTILTLTGYIQKAFGV